MAGLQICSCGHVPWEAYLKVKHSVAIHFVQYRILWPSNPLRWGHPVNPYLKATRLPFTKPKSNASSRIHYPSCELCSRRCCLYVVDSLVTLIVLYTPGTYSTCIIIRFIIARIADPGVTKAYYSGVGSTGFSTLKLIEFHALSDI